MYLVRAAGPPPQILAHGLSKLPVKSAGTGCQEGGGGRRREVGQTDQ